jgi:hypothetical protein
MSFDNLDSIINELGGSKSDKKSSKSATKPESIEKVNKKVLETVYKEAVNVDENISTLKLKVWLLSKKGEWVEVGKFGFTKDKLADISDFVREIVFNNVEDLSVFNLNGVAKVKFAVYDETGSKVLMENTIEIAIPKSYLKEKIAEKKEEVLVQTEANIWDGIKNFIELNKSMLENTLQMKEIEKSQLVEIFKMQIEAIKNALEQLKQKAIKGEISDKETLLMFMMELQKLRNEFELKMLELVQQLKESQQRKSDPLTETTAKVTEKLLSKVVEKAFEEKKPERIENKTEKPNELAKIAEILLEKALQKDETQVKLLDEVLKKELNKDKFSEIKQTVELIKALKDRDTGEDIKQELSQMVLEIAKRKLAEDPLEDLNKKIKLIKGIVNEIAGNENKVKEELKQEIDSLRQLLLMQQQQQQFDLFEEENKDPLEKLEKETERIARIYERMERLFGKREPASKTFLETIKEVLSSPTVVEIAKVFTQALVQMEQQKAMMMQMYPYAGMPMMPMQPVMPVRRLPRANVKRVPLQQQPTQQKPVQANQIQHQQHIPQRQPVTVGQYQFNIAQPGQPKQQTIADRQAKKAGNKESLREEIINALENQLKPIVEKYKKKTKGWEEKLVKELTAKIVEIEKSNQLIQRAFLEDQSLLLEFDEKVRNDIAEILGISKEEATAIATKVIESVIATLSS